MINIDREYRETILSKYNSLDKIIEKADVTDIYSSRNLIEPTTIVTLTTEILDNELDEIKETIFKNDKSAYYLSAEVIRLLMESTEYNLEAINVYEVEKDKFESTISKQIMLGSKEWYPVDKETYRMTVSDNKVNIITTNLVLETNSLSDYADIPSWINHGLKINMIGHPEIDIKHILEENNTNALFKALRNQITKIIYNETLQKIQLQ